MTIITSNEKIKKYYNLFLAFSGILAVYSSFIPGINLAEAVLIIFFILGLVDTVKIRIKKQAGILILLAFYAVFITIIQFSFNPEYEIFWFHRLIRFLFYISCAVVISSKFYDTELFIKYSKILVLLVTIGLVLQYAVYIFNNSYLRLYGSFLPIAAQHYMERDYAKILTTAGFRPSSFFLEPSHLAQWLIFILSFFMLSDSKEGNQNRLLWQGIITFNILLSTSLWGYLLLSFVYLIWLTRKDSRFLFFTPLIIIGLYFLIQNTEFMTIALRRIDLFDLTNDTTFSGRFLGYETVLNEGLFNIIFGTGFGNILDLKYLNSILYLLIGCGMVGIGIMLLFIINCINNGKLLWVKVNSLLFFSLLFGTSLMLSVVSVMCYTLMIYSDKMDHEVN